MRKLGWFKLVAAGLLIRLLLSFWTGNPHDFETFVRVGYFVANGASPVLSKYPYVEGLGQPTYPYVSGLGYLPAWGLYLAFAFKVYEAFPFSPYFYYFLLKLLPILGDLATTYIIYVLIMKFGDAATKAEKEKISLSFFLCPFVIFISSVWGMFDSIPVLFALLSLLLILSNKSYWSAFSLGLGIYFKVIPIIYLPIQLLFINQKRGLKETIIYLLIALIVPFLLTLIPVILYGWTISETAVTVLSQTQTTGDVLTYWNVSTLLRDMFPNMFCQEFLSSFFAFPPVRYLWVLGLMISYLSYYEYQQRAFSNFGQTENLDVMLTGFSFATIGFLLTRTFVPEQFVLYLLPTIVILSTNKPIQRYYKLIWALTLTFALVNLYPFAFAYLLDIHFWTAFNYLATTQPFSTLRYATRFIIAVLFGYYLLKMFSKMVRKK